MVAMAGFILEYVVFLLVYLHVSSTQSLLGAKNCDCDTNELILPDAVDHGLKGNCSCPEYGKIPNYIFKDILELELDYYQRVILRPDHFQKFRRIKFLSMSGVQFIEPGGFQGLETLERLTLHDNYMRVLESNMFTNLESLEELTVKGTPGHKIHALENGTFSNLTKLKHLNLVHNAIADIDEEYFRDLENLDQLYLSHNKLTQIKANTFIHMSLLTDIHISHNLITEIHQEAFIGLTYLTNLVLDGNSIKGMPRPMFLPGFFEFPVEFSAPRHITINLDDNPLCCDCHLNWISSWMASTHVCHGSCHSPIKEPLQQVYKDSLPQCKDNNTILIVEPGKQVELTCSFASASWMTPDGRSFQEHGDCEDPFCLTNSDSLFIWKTSTNTSGTYSCLSSDGTQEYFYHVVVNDTGLQPPSPSSSPQPQPTVFLYRRLTWAGIGCVGGFVLGLLVLLVVILIKQKTWQQRTPPTDPPQEDENVNEDVNEHDDVNVHDREPLVEREGDRQEAPAPVSDADTPARHLNSYATYKNFTMKKNLDIFPSGSI